MTSDISILVLAIVSFGMTWFCSASLWVKDKEWKEMLIPGLAVVVYFLLLALGCSVSLAIKLNVPWYYGVATGSLVLIAAPALYVRFRDRQSK